jgi:nucleoside phosphorylase
MNERSRRLRVDVLLLAAHPLELAPFAQALGAGMAAELHGLRVAAADVGVGLPSAGAGAARRMALHAPRAALLVGSYGVYPGAFEFAPGRVLIPSRVCATCAATLAGKAAFPQPMAAQLDTDAALSSGLAAQRTDTARGTLATTLGITTDDALAHELARSGCVAENLEAIAVALACHDAGAAFSAVLGCTNVVGAQGRKQWLEHRAVAARESAELVLDWLANGAPGLPA